MIEEPNTDMAQRSSRVNTSKKEFTQTLRFRKISKQKSNQEELQKIVHPKNIVKIQTKIARK